MDIVRYVVNFYQHQQHVDRRKGDSE